MLVLARQRDETIMIGNDVQVTVVDIRGDKVRLGINAPRTVPVHRKEVYEEIQRENREAAKMQPKDLDLTQATRASSTMKLVGVHPREREAHEPFLREAIEEAKKSLAEGGVPIGAVLVRGGKVIGRGHDRRTQKGDPTARAEIEALSSAGPQKTWRDTVLYSTLMPGYLCAGAAAQFGIPKVVAAESANSAGAADFMRSRNIEVIDLADADCIRMMADFVQGHPGLWQEDVGK